MSKIGRNDPCPCGSGIKYKKCCIGKTDQVAQSAAQQNIQISLNTEVEKLQERAANRDKFVHALGVFILFSTESGDGWLLEITDMDAIQVAADGEKIEFEIDENPDTIEINWPFHFSIKDKKFVTTAYADNEVKVWADYPSHRIASAVKKIRKKFPPELLKNIHLDEDEIQAA